MPSSSHEGPSVLSCPYRRNVRNNAIGEVAICERVMATTAFPEECCFVARDACEACCQSGWPSSAALNPVIAALVVEAASQIIRQGGIADCEAERAERVKQQVIAELELLPRDSATTIIPARSTQVCGFLGAEHPGETAVFECQHPDHDTTTLDDCRLCRQWARDAVSHRLSLEQLVPLTKERFEPRVSKWSVGVITAPRRSPTLTWCVDSLARAGWPRPHLFVDAGAQLPDACRLLPVTRRNGRVGAWPNFYLALAEMLHCDADADAYLIVQDDAYFYDADNLREYLQCALWPGDTPGLVSLYSTESNLANEPGWHVDDHRWLCGALAFVFPPEVATRLVLDQRLFELRRQAVPPGHIEIDALIGHWAQSERIPVSYPVPSLVQHVGNTSTLWAGSANGGPRRARWFAGDLEVPFHVDGSLSSFAESEFPVLEPQREAYAARVEAGRTFMRARTVVICGLCRDVRHWLPRTRARIERLGAMFRDYAVVLYENDSQDDTVAYLRDWQRDNPRVHVLSESLGYPRYPQVRDLDRAARLASCRNRYRDYAVREFGDYDYATVVDTDLCGGWSYDGVADTFGHTDWDFVGSYGVLPRVSDGNPPRRHLIHFDAWAFRDVDHHQPHEGHEINRMVLQRGESLLRVWSCFGGLGVYRMPCFHAARYAGGDCEHVQLHRALRNAGFDQLFLNPSQIVVY